MKALTIVLSLFEPKAAQCDWLKVEIPGEKKQVLSEFPHGCDGAEAIFDAKVSNALVWFRKDAEPSGYGGPNTPKPHYPPTGKRQSKGDLWRLKLGSPAIALPSPEGQGEIRSFCFGKDGAVLAQSIEMLESVKTYPVPESEDHEFKHAGKTYRITGYTEGLPGIARTLRLTADAKHWDVAETRGTSWGADYSQGTSFLEIRCDLPEPQRGATPVANEVAAALVKRLETQVRPLTPKVEQGSQDFYDVYKTKGEPAVDVLVWEIVGEFAHSTGNILFVNGDKVLRPPTLDFTAGDLVAISFRDNAVLVTTGNTGEHPRLIDAATGSQLFGSDQAQGVEFWPTP